ncbi:MAG: PD-(D/E)XK nuclease family protein [Cystobacter sp.]
MNLPSASALERAFACPGSQVLRQFKSRGTRWTVRGTVIHRFLVRVAELVRQGYELMDAREVALNGVPPKHFEACCLIELDRLPAADPSAYAYEVAFAYDLETDEARELGRNVDREVAYRDVKSTEVVGTIDVVGVAEDCVLVLDYKTGHRYFGPIAEYEQLLFAALAACRVYGKDRAMMAIIRLDEEGHPYFLWAEVTAVELDAFALRMRELDATISDMKILAASGQEPETVSGDHCQYCPAVAACPTYMAMARAMSSPEDDNALMPQLGEETGAVYFERLRLMKKVVERYEKALQLYAEQAPINLEGGWVYGKRPFPVDEWNVRKALPLLQGYFGEEALTLVHAEIYKKDIEEVFRVRKAADPKGPVRIGKDTEAVLASLKNHGAITTRYTWPVGRHRPDAALLEAAYAEEDGTAAPSAESSAA